MKRAIVVSVMVLLLALLAVQTVRVSYWKKLAGTQSASCNAVIKINNESCEKGLHDDQDILLRVHSHLWNVYKLGEARLANRHGIINVGEESRLLTLQGSELEAARDGNMEILNATRTITFVGSEGK